MNNRKLHSNIWKLYFIRAAKSFTLIMPVIVLFFQENGLSMKEVFLLQSLFSAAVILMEIPTGYFSDCFGRKKSIVIGSILETMGYIIYSQSYSFWGFLLAEIILGVGVSFISGADSAMLYDTLLEERRNNEYRKVEGRGLSMGLFAESVASILGGFLALISLRVPLYWDIYTTFLSVPVALTLVEPKRHKNESRGSSIKQILKLLKYTLNDHAEVKWLTVYSALVGAATLTMVWLIQPYLTATKVPLGFFGMIWAGFILVAALFSWNAHRVENFLGRKISLISLIILPVLGYFLLGSFWFIWSGAFITFFYITRGINNPVILDYINGLVSSDVRATVLSVKNLIGRLIFTVLGPIVGWVSDAYSLKAALVSLGMTFLVSGIVFLAFMKKHRVL